jgi:hypothetical protein
MLFISSVVSRGVDIILKYSIHYTSTYKLSLYIKHQYIYILQFTSPVLGVHGPHPTRSFRYLVPSPFVWPPCGRRLPCDIWLLQDNIT